MTSSDRPERSQNHYSDLSSRAERPPSLFRPADSAGPVGAQSRDPAFLTFSGVRDGSGQATHASGTL
jgi:hypothetical protein